MADLGDLLGTMMVSLVRARQLADEATAAVAERYRQHPLLEGMSVPRVRVPELTVEVPVLLKQDDPGEPAEPNPPEFIAAEVVKSLQATAGQAGVRLPDGFGPRLAGQLRTDLVAFRPPVPLAVAAPHLVPAAMLPVPPREAVARAAENAVMKALGAEGVQNLTTESKAALLAAVRQRAADVAEKKPGRPPSLLASVVTSEVKEQAGAANATRVWLTLREEGLEWTAVTASDGTTRRRLGPE